MRNCVTRQLDRTSKARNPNSNQRFASIRQHGFGHTQTGDLPRPVAGKHTMRSFGLHEFDLDDRWARLIHARDTAARHGLEGEEGHGVGAMAAGRG